jgi:predicted outer membrane lipoprotein
VFGWALSIGLACAFATTAQIVDESHMDAIMSSSTARWVVASLMAIITVLLAAAVFSPIRKMAKAAAAPQPAAAANKRATLQAQPVVPGRVVAAPIAANAVILV